MRIEIDYRACVKSGQCWYLQPQLFRQRKDGYPEPSRAEIGLAEREPAEAAADLCPGAAISLVDDVQ